MITPSTSHQELVGGLHNAQLDAFLRGPAETGGRLTGDILLDQWEGGEMFTV